MIAMTVHPLLADSPEYLAPEQVLNTAIDELLAKGVDISADVAAMERQRAFIDDVLEAARENRTRLSFDEMSRLWVMLDVLSEKINKEKAANDAPVAAIRAITAAAAK